MARKKKEQLKSKTKRVFYKNYIHGEPQFNNKDPPCTYYRQKTPNNQI